MKDWSNEDIEEFATLARALGHPARVQILRELITRGECIGGDIANTLPLAASTVSQHLKVLKNAGWISGRTDGPRRCYCVNETSLATFNRLVGEVDELLPAKNSSK